MNDELLKYYERELTYMRRLGAEFAARYPKVAARLQLEPTKCEDPHVERLLEGFAFLTARIHHRLDNDLPEISESLLDILHPQHVRPVPALSLVEFEIDPELGKVPEGCVIPRGSELLSRPVQGLPLRFRTAYTTTLWPATVAAAEWTSPQRSGAGARLGDAAGAFRIELRALQGLQLGKLAPLVPPSVPGGTPSGLDALRVHIAGESSVADAVYELLANSCTHIVVRDPDQPTRAPIVLDGSLLTPVGFAEDEALLPYPRRLLSGYALLQELFCFPQKFHFFDIGGLRDALHALEAGARAEIFLVVAPFERAERRQLIEFGISARTFRLGCTPIVNLFEQSGEPILLSHYAAEYPVVPDVRRRLEIEAWAVQKVVGITPNEGESHEIEPMYGFRHGRGAGAEIFWHVERRASTWRTDNATELHIAFSDRSGRLRAPNVDVASLRLTCFNGDLPSRLPFGVDERGDFELSVVAPVRRTVCLVSPTPVIQPPLGTPMLWRLISSLSLNHLSLVEEGREALCELLRLHNTGDSAAGERQIAGLVSVSSRASYARVASDLGLAFARGRRIELEFDEEHFPGGGMFLFASVVEHFLSLHATMNSFTQLAVRSRQRKRLVREWAPRAGRRSLL